MSAVKRRSSSSAAARADTDADTRSRVRGGCDTDARAHCGNRTAIELRRAARRRANLGDMTDTQASETNQYERIRYEVPAPGVGRITLARSDKANAQDLKMLYEIDHAFVGAMQDDGVKVVILAADGMHFSSGHDLKDSASVSDFGPVTGAGGFTEPGPHGHFATEQEIYVGLCWRWRNLPKPTIAQVQGRVIAGGLMLVWPCDLIIASDDATFSDPVVAFGVNGHEYFVHAWEVGHRKAKEMLFRGHALTAEECHRLGMVNH